MTLWNSVVSTEPSIKTALLCTWIPLLHCGRWWGCSTWCGLGGRAKQVTRPSWGWRFEARCRGSLILYMVVDLKSESCFNFNHIWFSNGFSEGSPRNCRVPTYSLPIYIAPIKAFCFYASCLVFCWFTAHGSAEKCNCILISEFQWF